MIDYGEKPSNQCEADLESPGARLMEDAREWISEHPDAWDKYTEMAHDFSKNGPVSPNLLLQLTRSLCRVSMRNALAPALARIAMEQDKEVRFRLARSMADGFCEVVL